MTPDTTSAPRRALVTGGAGFIGSTLVDRLLAAGTEVVVLDDLSTGRRGNLDAAIADGARLVEGSILDPAALADAAAGVDAILHLAAQIDVRRSVAETTWDARVNVEGTITVLELARALGAPLVLASTGGAIYGDAELVPTPESALELPLAPYGQAKLAAEGYVALYRRLHGVQGSALRFANVYGPRQDPLGEGGVCAIFCGRAAGGEGVTIFGDGGQTRDFVHVDDVCDALLAAVATPIAEPVNIGTGIETTVLELAELLRDLSGAELPATHEPERPGEVRRSCLDPARAREVLGWRPRVALRDGLAQTLAAART